MSVPTVPRPSDDLSPLERGRTVGRSTRQGEAILRRIDRSGPLTAATLDRIRRAIDRHPILSADGRDVQAR